jgi:hypothetical protein
MASHHAMPIPPDQRTDKGPQQRKADIVDDKQAAKVPDNPNAQGQQANTRLNTTHPGFRQGR